MPRSPPSTVARAAGDPRALTECRRAPDLIQTAAAVGEAAGVARAANQMAARLQGMMSAGAGTGVNMAALAGQATGTIVALNSLLVKLDRNFAPGKGDIAPTLANVRRMSGRASTIDVGSLDAILRQTQQMIARNQASIQGLLAQSNAGAAQARALLEGASASLISSSANLERVSDSLSTLAELAAADPTFVIRGRRFKDPPAPESKR